MRTTFRRNHPQAGVALIIALLALLILSVLAASIMFVTQTETWATANHRSMIQARYAAEAGAQKTLNWLAHVYAPPANMAAFNQTKYPIQLAGGGEVIFSAMTGVTGTYPDAAQQSAFSAALKDISVPGVGVPASYEVTAKLFKLQGAGIQTWEVTSQGNVPGISNAQVQVVMKIEKVSPPGYGIFATGNTCNALTFGGGGGIDSFDSSAGTYAATKQTTGGNIGTNGNIGLSGGGGTAPLIKTIDGTISSPYTGTGNCVSGSPDALSEGSGWTTGALVQLNQSVIYPTPPPPSPLPPTTGQNIRNNCSSIAGCSCYPGGGYACTNSGPYKLTPGSYGDLLMGGGKVLHLSAGTYIVNSLALGGGSVIVVDSGPVIITPAAAGIAAGTCCAVDFSGGGIQNASGIPNNLQIIFGGQAQISLSGGAGDYGVIYAPNAPVSIGGGGDFYGAIVGKTVDNGGGTSVHYDTSLQILSGGQFFPVSFTWSKF